MIPALAIVLFAIVVLVLLFFDFSNTRRDIADIRSATSRQRDAAVRRASVALRPQAAPREEPKDFLDVEGLTWPLTKEKELELKLQTARNARIRAAREAHAQKVR